MALDRAVTGATGCEGAYGIEVQGEWRRGRALYGSAQPFGRGRTEEAGVERQRGHVEEDAVENLGHVVRGFDVDTFRALPANSENHRSDAASQLVQDGVTGGHSSTDSGYGCGHPTAAIALVQPA